MGLTCIFTDVMIPLFSALIGGGLTLLGVFLTIKDQNKKEEIARKAAARPWIYSCEERHFLCNPKLTYSMGVKTPISREITLTGKIKNTDNGLLFLECVKSEKATYYPNGCNVVEKNTIFELMVYLLAGVENLRDVKLYINDIYGNRYCYDMICIGERFVLGKCEEVKTCPTST